LNRRLTAKLDGDFVVFLIGARLNRWWKLPQQLWFLGTMPKMLKELEANPASGFLGYEALSLTIVVQYWRSLEQLIAYARNRDQSHYPMCAHPRDQGRSACRPRPRRWRYRANTGYAR
jgi:hypothetical protein